MATADRGDGVCAAAEDAGSWEWKGTGRRWEGAGGRGGRRAVAPGRLHWQPLPSVPRSCSASRRATWMMSSTSGNSPWTKLTRWGKSVLAELRHLGELTLRIMCSLCSIEKLCALDRTAHGVTRAVNRLNFISSVPCANSEFLIDRVSWVWVVPARVGPEG